MKPHCRKCLPALLSLALVMMALVCRSSAQTLTHRYSFNDPAYSQTFADSVGGAAWAGTLVTNGGAPYLDGAELQLDGLSDFAQIPAGVFSNDTQVTVEFWADFPADLANFPSWMRVFSFGSQNNGNKDSGIDFAPNAGGNYLNLDISAIGSSDDVYANSTPDLVGVTNAHVTVVVDPVNDAAYYYIGLSVLSTQHGNPGPVAALSSMNDDFDVIGRSLYDGDPTLLASINELRVYSGVVSPAQVALNDAAGPNTYTTTPGALTALRFSSPANPLVVNQTLQQLVYGDFASITNVNLALYGGVTYSSGNPNVLTINSNGVVKAVGAGTTTVIATDGGISITNSLTVVSIPAALIHRFSFAADASDSVGNANGTLEGNAQIANGQVVLDGSSGTYVSLPGNLINIATNSSVTFEAWTTIGAISEWSHLFEFGSNAANLIYCAPRSDAGGFHEWGLSEDFASGGQTLSWAHGWSDLTIHYTGVVDPIDSTLAVYTNGVLMQAMYNATAPLSEIDTNFASIGKSSFGDPYAVLSVDEFRIYTGALSPAQIAMSDQSGPNSVNFSPGALTSITVAPANYPAFSSVAPVIRADYANLSNFNLLPNLMASEPGLVVTSSDPSIVSVNGQNMLTTGRPGTVTLTATYLGKTSSATVRVQNQAILTHRYSFTNDGSTNVIDTVSGADGFLVGNANVAGGQVQLDGGSGDYVSLPGGLLNTYRSATMDIWATIDSGQSQWSRLFEFADVGPATANEVYFAPAWGNPPTGSFMADGVPYAISNPLGGAFVGSPGPPLIGLTVHLTCVLGDGSMELYTNGVPYDGATNLLEPADQAGAVGSWIGYSPYGDPGILGSVAEYRIYEGRLSLEEIEASDLLGPTATLSTAASLSASVNSGSLVLSWPVADAGFAVASKSSLVPDAAWTILTNAPTLVGAQWQVTLPVTGANQFYELVR